MALNWLTLISIQFSRQMQLIIKAQLLQKQKYFWINYFLKKLKWDGLLYKRKSH